MEVVTRSIGRDVHGKTEGHLELATGGTTAVQRVLSAKPFVSSAVFLVSCPFHLLLSPKSEALRDLEGVAQSSSQLGRSISRLLEFRRGFRMIVVVVSVVPSVFRPAKLQFGDSIVSVAAEIRELHSRDLGHFELCEGLLSRSVGGNGESLCRGVVKVAQTELSGKQTSFLSAVTCGLTGATPVSSPCHF